MNDYKSPRLIKLYYKPSTDATVGKAYLRNMSGSKLAGIFICHNEEQVEEVKSSRNLKMLYNENFPDFIDEGYKYTPKQWSNLVKHLQGNK